MIDRCENFHDAQSATLTARDRSHDEGGGTRPQEDHDRSPLPVEDGPDANYCENWCSSTFMVESLG